MKRFLMFIAVLLIVLIILANVRVKEKVYEPGSVAAEDAAKAQNYTVNFMCDADIPEDDLDDVRAALMLMPASVIKDFVDDNWKLIITNQLNKEAKGYAGAGDTDFDTKTIQIKPIKYKGISGFTKLMTVHEMCHFADKTTYNNASSTEAFIKLYEAHRYDYIAYEFSGAAKASTDEEDIAFATSDRYEFFACAMKDFLCNPQYLLENYPDVHAYFDSLIKGD